MKPEEKAREQIDELLTAAGWVIQNYKALDLGASLGVAVREFPMKTGFADYSLFIDRECIGVIEAKAEGVILSSAAEQDDKYIKLVPTNIPHVRNPLPFAYESTGIETFFRDTRDTDFCSRRVFAFHKPETLKEMLANEKTLRNRLKELPPLIKDKLRDCQTEAITNLELSLSEAKPRALIQMATGAGKTFTAVNFVYRLIKHAGAKRVLFLVDRNNLGRQTKLEFQQFETPDDHRKFTDLYNIQHLTSNTIDPVCKVTITTIQRLFSMLKGDKEYDPDLDEISKFEVTPSFSYPVEVKYNPAIPIETYDFIVTDECHRSIYNLWRQVLEYFDGFLIGLTATPSKQTIGFFNNNLVMEYSHERAVADGVNVGYDVYRIKTAITEKGSKVEAGNYIDKREKATRKIRWEELDKDFLYEANDLDRSVVSIDQIRTIIKTFKAKLFTEIFPGRTEVPKTLIFAKDDSHAEDIVNIIREEFGKGNDFCKKITYKIQGERAEDLIQSFRNSYYPRIAVTVDMISTGTDIKPLECLIFMRDVRSRIYFEQMKGRGTRVIDPTDLQMVSPDVKTKSGFMIVDTVGVCESDKSDTKPLERLKSVSFEKLIIEIAKGDRRDDNLSSLAGRLARLDRQIEEKDRKEIESTFKKAGLPEGTTLKKVINKLLDAIDQDIIIEKAKELSKNENPTDAEINKAEIKLKMEACLPLDKPEVRDILTNINKKTELIIDKVSQDTVLSAGFDDKAKEKAQKTINTFKQFIEDNKDELTAIQIIYSKQYAKRHATYEEIKEIAGKIERPPYSLNTESVWKAFEQLEKSKVRNAGPQKLLTDIISLIRFAVGSVNVLEPFKELVNQNFETWLEIQEKNKKIFTRPQLDWLYLIKDHIAASLSIEIDDFQYSPFNQRGGVIKAAEVFGNEFEKILEELNKTLVA